MRILITGGAGFLGSELVKALAKARSNQITIFDSFTHGFSKKPLRKRNIDPPISGNIQNYYDIFRVIEKTKPEIIFHLAAFVTRPEAMGEFRKCAEVNYVGTANLIEACLSTKEKPKRIIFASCEAAKNPKSHYGISKAGAENLFESLCPTDIDLITLRFSEIYGYSASHTSSSLINFLVDNMIAGNGIALFNVNVKRDFVHLSDAVRACELALSSEHHRLSKIDIGTGQAISIKRLAQKLKKLSDYKGQFKFIENPYMSVLRSEADVEPALKLLGFECEADFETEIKALITKRRKDLKWKK